MKTIYLLPLCALLRIDPTPTPVTPTTTHEVVAEKNFFRFGDQLVFLEAHGRENARNYVLLALHSNEHAATATALEFSKSTQAYFIRLMNNDRKKIEGYFLDQKISFDPNNIYTDWGRKEHLKLNRCWNKYVDLKVEQFSEFIWNEIPHDKTIVSLHAHHGQSINDYVVKRRMKKQVKEMHVNPLEDAANYYLTTDEGIFSRLKKAGCNAVLLHAKRMENNGAIAVHCAREKRPYVQVEAGGDESGLVKMLTTLDHLLK